MVNIIRRIDRQKFVKVDLFDLYLFASFLSSLVLWSGLYLKDSAFLPTSFASSLLLVGHYFYFIQGLGYSHYLKETPLFSGLFIFQISTLVGMSFLRMHSMYLFLALIPCMAGSFFFIRRESFALAWKKCLGLFLMGGSMAYLMGAFLPKAFLHQHDLLILTSFALWTGVLISLGGSFVSREQRSFLFSLLKRRKNSPYAYSESREKKERFFYHDLINQTHGLNLFLGQRLNNKQGISREECQDLLSEVKTIQSLIKDHYGFGHRDLVNTYHFIDFEMARSGLMNLIQTFLPEHQVKTEFIFRGYLSEEVRGKGDCPIHYPSVYRIINNLVKNMAEQNVKEAEIIFDYNDRGLVIQTRNKLFKLKDESENLAKDLSEIILEAGKEKSSQLPPGQGLDSISSLCEELGGRFTFAVEGEYWLNNLFLPRPGENREEQQDIFGKAA